ncbi:MAG TPA: hypothetical protein VHE13_16420 [Opitutus sp.]|nr:hypothetical protein [Opitutus sp.]
MVDIIKKTLLAGVGAIVITKEKVETTLNELVKQGRISAAEARQMADKIAEQGRQEFESLSRELGEKVSERIASLDRKAHARIEALEVRVAALERGAPAAAPADTPGGASV